MVIQQSEPVIISKISKTKVLVVVQVILQTMDLLKGADMKILNMRDTVNMLSDHMTRRLASVMIAEALFTSFLAVKSLRFARQNV